MARWSTLTLVTGCMMLLSSICAAQDVREHTFRFSYGQALEHPMGQGAQKFAALVAQKSGGKMKISIFPNAVLGGDNQNLSGIRGGTIDMTTTVTGGLTSIEKEFMIFDFPFLFNNAQEAQAIADGPIGKRLLDKLPDKGIIGLAFWELGFRNVTNSRRPLNTVEDIQGLKLRVVQVPIYIDMFNSLGANAVPLAFPELYTALEQRAVDGQENPIGLIEATKFYEVQKYLTLTRHTYSAMPIMMSKKKWDTLTPAERKILADSANQAKVEERRINREAEGKSLEAIKKVMQVNELPPAELQKMRTKLQPVVDKYTQEVGESLVKQVHSELEAIRGRK